jgi:hypothetical protein
MLSDVISGIEEKQKIDRLVHLYSNILLTSMDDPKFYLFLQKQIISLQKRSEKLKSELGDYAPKKEFSYF